MDCRFHFMEKSEFDRYAPQMFALLWQNMSSIAPISDGYEVSYADWHRQYGGAFSNRKERKIVWVETLSLGFAGFFGYCEDGEVFRMEEIQLASACRGRDGVFRKLYGFVLETLSKELRWVEAYAHKTNEKSLAVLRHLGLVPVGENERGDCLLLRGRMSDFLSWYSAERPEE